MYYISISLFVQMSPCIPCTLSFSRLDRLYLVCVCLQVHRSGDARIVQHHPSLQEESFGDDCHCVGPGLRCLLSPAVWLQHHRSGQQYFIDFRILVSRCREVESFRLENRMQGKKLPFYSENQSRLSPLVVQSQQWDRERSLKWDLKAHSTNLARQSQFSNHG